MNAHDLKRIRSDLGLTQQRFAEALGVTRRSYVGWEMGERDIPQPVQILAELARTSIAARERLGITKLDV